MKNHSSLILIGFLAIGAACGCGAHDGSPTEAGSNDGTDTTADTSGSGRSESIRTAPSSYGRRAARNERDYLRVATPEAAAADSCCDGIETHTDATPHASPGGSDEEPSIATVYVSPRGSDNAPGTHEEPVLTLSRAIRLAAERGHTVAVEQ